MNENVVMLMFCDSRADLSSQKVTDHIRANSIFVLPKKRELLRKYSAGKSIVGEVIIDIERDSNMEFLVDAAVHQASLCDTETVVSLDRPGLEQAGIYDLLSRRLEEKGLTLRECRI